MSEIDWSKAPEGFDYWIESRHARGFKKLKEGNFYSTEGFWIVADSEDINRIVTRPETVQPVWNGEGKPPVGAVCELQDINTKTSVTIIPGELGCAVEVWSNGDKLEVIAYIEVCGLSTPVVFNVDQQIVSAIQVKYLRPIKTEKEKAVKVMWELIGGECNRNRIFAKLYDAGYKLPKD